MVTRVDEIVHGCGGKHGQSQAGFLRITDTSWIAVDAIVKLEVKPDNQVLVLYQAGAEVWPLTWEHGLPNLLNCLTNARMTQG